MINKLGLPLFIIGIILILISFSKTIQTANIRGTQNIHASISPIPTSSSNAGSESQALITKVVDGDTVDVEINGKKDVVRLVGINAPETNECFGKEATNKAREIFQGKSAIRLEADLTQDNRDKYNRILRYIFLPDGTNFGELMIKNGFAKEYTYKAPYKYQSLYKKAQEEAKNNKVGLWASGACSNWKSTLPVKAQSTFSSQATSSNQSFSCDCSKLCSQIQTCEEAYFQLNNCGCTKRDSDGDGVPCESLCR